VKPKKQKKAKKTSKKKRKAMTRTKKARKKSSSWPMTSWKVNSPRFGVSVQVNDEVVI